MIVPDCMITEGGREVSGLFTPGAPGVVAATSDEAWLRAMLAFEVALAHAAADVGLVPRAAAEAVTRACAAIGPPELAQVAAGFGRDATPVVALLDAVRGRLPQGADAALHVGATSQDVVDTALALVARDAVAAVDGDVVALADRLAGLAREHRDTPQVGRTLGQHARPTTFGAACAARLVAVEEARHDVLRVVRERLAVQLGGAVGTLDAAGPDGEGLRRRLAARLGLADPVVAWHTGRGRVAQLAAALGVLAGELAAVAQDVVLLAATDVAELVPRAGGASSAMPHKRNPARAVLAVAAAHRVPGLVATVLAGMPQELQRSAGRWQAEAAVLTELLRLTGATAAQARAALEDADVDAPRMRAAVEGLLATTGGRFDPGPPAAVVDRVLEARHAPAAPPAAEAPVVRAAPGRAPEPVEPGQPDATAVPDGATGYERGMAVRRAVLGDAHVDRAGGDPFTEDLQRYVTEHVWGALWTRPGLTRHERSIATLALLAGLGRTAELPLHVRGALNNGLTVEQVREVLLHTAAYAGAPAAHSAFDAAARTLAELAADPADPAADQA